MAKLRTAVSWAAIQLDSAAIHSLEKVKKETGKNDMEFPWLPACITPPDHYHKFCHPNKQQMSEIMFGFGKLSFRHTTGKGTASESREVAHFHLWAKHKAQTYEHWP